MKNPARIVRVVIVRENAEREEIFDRDFYVETVTVKWKARAKGADCRTEVRR